MSADNRAAPNRLIDPSFRGRLPRFIFYALVLSSLGLVWFANHHWIGQDSQPFIPAPKGDQQADTIVPYLKAGLASVDQTVSMLYTVQLSLFVLVGFVFREPLTKGHRLTTTHAISGCVFLASALVSLTLGYAARMQALRTVDLAIVDFASVKFSAIQTTVANQAFAVVISAIAAISMVGMFLFEGDREVHTLPLELQRQPGMVVPLTSKNDIPLACTIARPGKSGRDNHATREADDFTNDTAHDDRVRTGSAVPEGTTSSAHEGTS